MNNRSLWIVVGYTLCNFLNFITALVFGDITPLNLLGGLLGILTALLIILIFEKYGREKKIVSTTLTIKGRK